MLEEIYCYVDDFYQKYSPEIKKSHIESGNRKRIKPSRLGDSEVITIMVLFYQSPYRNFKHFYLDHFCQYLKSDFPCLISYSRFVELKSKVIIYIMLLSKSFTPKETGFYFIDSTPLEVCHIKKEKPHIVECKN